MSSAALPLLGRADGRLLRLDPALLLGAGGEARVFALSDDAGRVAKVYHRPTDERARKIARMIADPPLLGEEDGVRLAWPEEALRDPAGRVAGFVMPRAEGPRIFEFYNPVTRRAQSPLFHYGLLHRAGAHLAAAFAALHARGYVVGDVNESNILVAPDGRVSLVDTDSFQVPDAATVLRSGVGRPEFTPPELQGVTFTDVDRAPEHDRFGLGVLIFLLLMEGTHPFAVRVEGEPVPVEDRIRAGMFPHAKPAPGRPRSLPPRLAPPFDVLHPTIRELFLRCFVDGHADPAARPAAAEWQAALATAELELQHCPVNAQHRFGRHLDACPWCERAALLRGRDPFPATAEAARVPARRREKPVREVLAALPGAAGPLAMQWPPAPLPASVQSSATPTFSYRLGTAVNQSLSDPAVWVLPLIVLGMLASSWLGLAVGLTGAAVSGYFAVTATPPRKRRWLPLIAVSLVLVAFMVMRELADAGASPANVRDESQARDRSGTAQESALLWQPAQLVNLPDVEEAAAEVGASLGLSSDPTRPVVVLRVSVPARGDMKPGTIEVERSSGLEYTKIALRLAKIARFSPGIEVGRPVPSTATLWISFPGKPRA